MFFVFRALSAATLFAESSHCDYDCPMRRRKETHVLRRLILFMSWLRMGPGRSTQTLFVFLLVRIWGCSSFLGWWYWIPCFSSTLPGGTVWWQKENGKPKKNVIKVDHLDGFFFAAAVDCRLGTMRPVRCFLSLLSCLFFPPRRVDSFFWAIVTAYKWFFVFLMPFIA